MTVEEHIEDIEENFKIWAESNDPDPKTYEGAFEFKEHLIKMAGVQAV